MVKIIQTELGVNEIIAIVEEKDINKLETWLKNKPESLKYLLVSQRREIDICQRKI